MDRSSFEFYDIFNVSYVVFSQVPTDVAVKCEARVKWKVFGH